MMFWLEPEGRFWRERRLASPESPDTEPSDGIDGKFCGVRPFDWLVSYDTWETFACALLPYKTGAVYRIKLKLLFLS